MENESSLIQFVKTHRSGLLIVALVIQMIVSPVADYHPRAGALLAAFVWLLVIAAAVQLANRKIVRSIVLPIGVLWAIARMLEAFGDHRHAYARLAPAFGLALSCAVLWAIFDRLRSAPRATGTTIAESFVGYLVIATAFAQLYWILNQVLEKPFNQNIPAYEISTFLYFSLITITSVGYGGIVPVNPYVRMVAAFESVVGVFYVAVIVARLVSSYRTSAQSQG